MVGCAEASGLDAAKGFDAVAAIAVLQWARLASRKMASDGGDNHHEAEERALAPLLSVLDFPHVRVTAQAPWCSSVGGGILQRAARLGVPFDFATAATNESGASQDKTMKTLILSFTSSFLKLLSEMGVRGQASK